MVQLSVAAILNEARTLAVYALRTGRLPKDSLIFERIDEITAAQARGDDLSIAPLIGEMGKVSLAAGITVQQLMSRNTVLGRLRKQATHATPFLVGFVTLLLTLYLAFQSSELHKAELALREYQDLVSERLQEKIYLAWKMYHYEHVLNVTGPPLAQLDGYQKLVDDAKRLHDKRVAVRILLDDSSNVRYIPEMFQYHGPCWLQDLARTMNSQSSSSVTPACTLAQQSEAADTADTAPSSRQGEFPLLKLDCSTAQARPGGKGKAAILDNKIDLDGYTQSIACFVRSLQITGGSDQPVDPAIYATRNKVTLLVSWFLPGLYGLLGACVLLMREQLDVNCRTKAHGDVRIVDLLSLTLRMTLGGLAGIIIGWFWVPTGLGANSSVSPVSSIPFGMAFLAGYSIDSLFTLLDRLNKTIGQRDDGKSAKDTSRATEADSKA